MAFRWENPPHAQQGRQQPNSKVFPAAGSKDTRNDETRKLQGEVDPYEDVLHSVKAHFNYLEGRQISDISKKAKTKFDQYFNGLLSIVKSSHAQQAAKPDGLNGQKMHGQAARDERSRNPVDELEQQLISKSEEITSLRKQLRENQTLLAHATEQFSQQFNKMAQNMDRQVAKDERQLENVSVKARPMNIQGEYQDICSNEWNDAKSLLDSKRIQAGEQQKMTFLVDIFLFSLEAAEKTLSAVMKNIALQVADPMCNEKSALDPYPPQHVASQLRTSQHHGGGHESGSGGAQFAMPENVENSIRDVYRTRANSVKVDKLCEVTEEKMRHKYQNDYNLNNTITQTPVKTFIKACATLAWKMVLQRPPMRFSVSNVERKFNPGEEEPFWGSKDPNSENATVGYYVHPALYHKDVLMIKGKVHLVMARKF